MAPVGPTPAGDFETFFRAQHEPMLRLAYLLTQSRTAAEDAVQDAFVRVQPRFGGLDQPAAYLRRTVANACADYHRRRKVEQSTPISPPATGQPAYDELWDALATLAPRQRAVLVLRYYLDLSESDIAATLGCRPGTVKSLTSRALENLRKVVPQ